MEPWQNVEDVSKTWLTNCPDKWQETPAFFTTFLSTIFLPLNHPLPISKMMDFLFNFYWGPQTDLRTLGQNCEQTFQELRTNRIMNNRAVQTSCPKATAKTLSDNYLDMLVYLVTTSLWQPCPTHALFRFSSYTLSLGQKCDGGNLF